jgi:hypothetical protein
MNKKLTDDKPLPSEELMDEMDQKGQNQPDQMHGLLWVIFVLTFVLPTLLLIWLWIQL